jgi:general secretion pathway protein E/type IV pilus assembly protein PilB
MSIAERLLERGQIDMNALQRLHEARALTPDRAEHQILIEKGLANESDVLKMLADDFGIPIVELENAKVEKDALEAMPSRIVHKRNLMPLKRENGSLTVATGDPQDVYTLDELQMLTGLRIRPVLASPREIARLIKNYYGVGGETVTQLVAERKEDLELLEDLETDDSELAKMAQEASVVKLVNEILIEAINEQASDVHVEPSETSLRIRYRIDGRLQTQMLPPEIARFSLAMVSRIKIMSRLNIAEKRLPQDGRIKMRVQGREIDVRVSIIPMSHGEGIVMRILDKGRMVFNLANVGMLPDTYKTFKELIDKPHGIVLVTGPTGSGKSTTLYSALNEIKDETLKIITVEDPVEYQMEAISQIQVHHKIGLSFAAALRSILRHDPDVVLIGEMRDLETAESAIQASLTGHLVFSTLHTNDAPGAFTRMIDMGLEPYLVGSTVEGVMAQRLVRTICKQCKEEDVHAEEHALPHDFPKPPAGAKLKLFRGVGCKTCRGTGYKGRTGIYELMVTDDEIRDLCSQRISASIIRRKALEKGMMTLRQDGYRKVLAGHTTVDEVVTATIGDLS